MRMNTLAAYWREFGVKARAFQLRSAGFAGAAAKRWISQLDRERRFGDAARAELAQAHRWGFRHSTVEHLGIDRSNRNDFITERDYAFIQPLNGKYAKWVRDRASTLTIFKPHRELFEVTHYHLLLRDGRPLIIPLTEQARHFEMSVSGMAALLERTGSLTLANSPWLDPASRTIEYSGSTFLLDGEPLSHEQFEAELLRRLIVEPQVMFAPAVPDGNFFEHAPENLGSSLRVSMANPGGADAHVAEACIVFSEGGRESVDYVCRVEPSTGGFEGARAIQGAPAKSELHRFDAHPRSGRRFCGKITGWEGIATALTQLCRFAPQLEFVEFHLVLTADGPKIVSVSPDPEYSQLYPFSAKTAQMLRQKIEQKKRETHRVSARTRKWLHNTRLKARKIFAAALYPKGLVPYQSVRWIGDVLRDMVSRNGVPVKTKLWAYRHGFLSYRVPQYGITPQNRLDFISDFEYRWLRHINGKYKYWLEDKISFKYVVSDFNESLPGYYYYTNSRYGNDHIVPMMDCPEGYGTTVEDILRLAREKNVLALKPDEGSHGDGFYRLAYHEDDYSLNGKPVDRAEVVRVLRDPANQYLVTEFIESHPMLTEIYPDSVNTIRVIVFKRDGITPQIGNAYLRIGSSKSGFVDNTAAGGMLAEIDPLTGRFGNAQVLTHGRVRACPRHPDTGMLIEGELPHWDLAKQRVLEIAADMPQLEYFGFDLALTAEGIKLPEINRFPDYPRIERLTPQTTGYLLERLEQKKREHGYDQHQPRCLIRLPERHNYSQIT